MKPCPNCQRVNPAHASYCMECGTALQTIDANQVVYNVFSCWAGMGEPYSMVYAYPFESEEALMAEAGNRGTNPRMDTFCGGYALSGVDGMTVSVQSWKRIGLDGLGEDEGPRQITLTNLER